MRNIWFLLSFVLLVFSCDNDKIHHSNLISLAPQNSSIIIKTNSVEGLNSALKNNSLFKAISKYDKINVLEKKLSDHDVDVVGVSCTFTMNHENMIEIFNEVKKFNKSIITIAGGVHVSNATEFVLKEGKNIDFAVTHEAEKSFVNFLDFVNGKVSSKPYQASTILDGKLYQISDRKNPEENE